MLLVELLIFLLEPWITTEIASGEVDHGQYEQEPQPVLLNIGRNFKAFASPITSYSHTATQTFMIIFSVTT